MLLQALALSFFCHTSGMRDTKCCLFSNLDCCKPVLAPMESRLFLYQLIPSLLHTNKLHKHIIFVVVAYLLTGISGSLGKLLARVSLKFRISQTSDFADLDCGAQLFPDSFVMYESWYVIDVNKALLHDKSFINVLRLETGPICFLFGLHFSLG